MFKAQQAMIALTTVIIIGAVSVLIVVFIVLAGVDLLTLGLYDTKSTETFFGSDACVEEALVRLNSDSAYTGGSISIGNVSCVITVSGAGSTRTIDVASTLDSLYSSDIQVEVTLTPKPITIDDWTEVVN